MSKDDKHYLLFCSKLFWKIWWWDKHCFQHTSLLEEENFSSQYGQIVVLSPCLTIKKNNVIFIAVRYCSSSTPSNSELFLSAPSIKLPFYLSFWIPMHFKCVFCMLPLHIAFVCVFKLELKFFLNPSVNLITIYLQLNERCFSLNIFGRCIWFRKDRVEYSECYLNWSLR